MKIIKVTYTTTRLFSEQNQLNIKTVMTDMQKINKPGINYTACLCPDDKTFIHTAFFETEEAQQTLNELPSFKEFQQALKNSGLKAAPKQELLSLIGALKNIF